MARTKHGTQIESGSVEVTLASGAGSSAVTFREPFVQAPQVLLADHLGDEAAALTASSLTENGFTLDVASSGLPDGDVVFEWVAHERS